MPSFFFFFVLLSVCKLLRWLILKTELPKWHFGRDRHLNSAVERMYLTGCVFQNSF